MILEKNNLQTAQDSLICTPPKKQSSSITFKSHIMALDHRRLIRAGKKIRLNFLRSAS